MSKRHSVKERERAVRRCLAGKSARQVSKELGIRDHYIYEWVERYRMYGRKGLERQPYHEWSFEEKREIVLSYLEKGVPLHAVSSRYRVAQSTVSKWAKAV
ncbi:MAG: helix-turn-helix domain-containing protein, partial [Bacteroidales bacterium]|nr:helix-turn-helix domain-containing protein [Bacteroidales bacterium]